MPFLGYGVVLWRLVPPVIVCSVWKERHNHSFRSSSKPVEDLLQMGFVQIAKWVSSRSKFDTSISDDIIFS